MISIIKQQSELEVTRLGVYNFLIPMVIKHNLCCGTIVTTKWKATQLLLRFQFILEESFHKRKEAIYIVRTVVAYVATWRNTLVSYSIIIC